MDRAHVAPSVFQDEKLVSLKISTVLSYISTNSKTVELGKMNPDFSLAVSHLLKEF